MNPPEDTLPQRYLRLWNSTLPAIRNGEIEIDSVLASGIPDGRRGFTLIARPCPEVQSRIMEFLHELRGLEPEQYYYHPDALHMTVLSLFTATEHYEKFTADVGNYQAATHSALKGIHPFQIEFRGITASTGAIMVQGFPDSTMLETVRTRLRSELLRRGLNDGVDSRYRLITAHITVARFRKSLRDGRKFASELEQWRETSFGTSSVKELSLIGSDWYASPETVTTLSTWTLSQTLAPAS